MSVSSPANLNAAGRPGAVPAAVASPDAVHNALPAEAVDKSCRWAVWPLAVAALGWLFLGLLMQGVASFRLVAPDILSDSAVLTYGRLRPAAVELLIYGFGLQACVATAFWILARLGRTQFQGTAPAIAGWVLWNSGVAIGLAGILAGSGSGYEALQFPKYAGLLLLAGFGFWGVAAFLTFSARREPALYPSQWFIIAGFLWFAWIYATAQCLIFWMPARGVMQVVAGQWYLHNLKFLCFSAFGLAAAFYFIPKATGRPLYSAPLAKFAFWTLAFFGAGGGFAASLPLPRWMPAVSSVCNFLLLTCAVAVALNFLKTVAGVGGAVAGNLSLRWFRLAVSAWLLAVLAEFLLSRPVIGEYFRFTWVTTAADVLILAGFVILGQLGAFYYMMPRLAQKDWPCQVSPKANFWASSAGILIIMAGYIGAGIAQGRSWINADTLFLESVTASKTWLAVSAAGWLLFAIGQIPMFANLFFMARQELRGCCCCCADFEAGKPTEVRS